MAREAEGYGTRRGKARGEPTLLGKWIAVGPVGDKPETLTDRDRRREPFPCVQPGPRRTSASVGFLRPVCLSRADGPFVCLALCLFVSLFACLSPGSSFFPLRCLSVGLDLTICCCPLPCPSLCGEKTAPWDCGIPESLSLGLRQVLAFPLPEFGSQFPLV